MKRIPPRGAGYKHDTRADGAGLLLALFVGLLFIHLLASCGIAELKPFPVDMAVAIPDASFNDGGTYSSGGQSGNLPLGFYGLQCQWDACEPPPTRTQPATDPVR